MAEYWVERVMREYDELIEAKFAKVGKMAVDGAMEKKNE
jgi:hypothetical protein